MSKKKGNPAVDLLAGGTAGMMEALACHPLDTIKVRMQLSAQRAAAAEALRIGKEAAAKAAQAAMTGSTSTAANAASTGARTAAKVATSTLQKRPGFISTGARIVRKEGLTGLYKGLDSVLMGITPKMAIRFSSYEEYKRLLTPLEDRTNPHAAPLSTSRNFVAGLGAGLTEALLVVTPMEVVKIRLQAQSNSMADPVDVVKYRNALHCGYTVVKEEGISALYRGVTLTAARQASNQAVNFTVYSELKKRLQQYHGDDNPLPGWQTSIIGLISGALGPMSNAPLDTIKTRMQRESGMSTESGFARFMRIARELVQREGASALYRGITPRVMRVAPGQAVTFTVYEYARTGFEKLPIFQTGQTV